MIAEPILPCDGERNVHSNASFEPHFLDRAIELALAKGAGVALLHSHLGPGWQAMSADDIAAEQGNAGQVLAATGLPLVGLTIGTDGALSARFWIRARAREYRREWCETVRVVGQQFQITFDDEQRPAPRVEESQRRTVSAWGPEMQAKFARLRIGIVGAGSVGNLVGEALARMGIRRVLDPVDFDVVESLNLDRLLHATRPDAQLGRPKAEVLARGMRGSATARRRTDRPVYEVSPSVEPDGMARAP